MTKKVAQVEEVISLIQAAIGKCGQDFATSDIRGHLIAARNTAEHVLKKRGRRIKQQTAMEQAITKAINLNNDWWSKIQENVRNQAKADAEKPTENIEIPKDQE